MSIDGNSHRKSKPTSGDAKGRARAVLIVCLVLLAVLVALAAAGISHVSRMETIFPNVSIDGLDIGGLTLAETAEKLTGNGYGSTEEEILTVALPADYTLTVSVADVCTSTGVSDIALAAYDACKGGSALQNAVTYLRCLLTGMELESGAEVTVDESAVRALVLSAAQELRLKILGSDLTVGEDSIAVVKGAQNFEIDTDTLTARIVEALEAGDYSGFAYEGEITSEAELDLDELYESVYAEAADAYYDTETGEIVDEIIGIDFDRDTAQRLWDTADYGDTVEIPLVLTQPEVTAEYLESLLFRDCLSSMTTSLSGSSSNRINNVTLAAQSINGIVLQPGEQFSYNDALGERTAENGYLMAGAYANGQTVQEYGGGICQVSSTLYYCCLYANLDITTRTSHYFPVNYLPAGLDATVSWGGPEYKFVNDRDYPIRIDAYVDTATNSVVVELWGTDVDGSYVEITYNTWYFYDSTWTDVALGYKAQTYRCVYDADGNLLSRQPEALSTYYYHSEDIVWPAEATATEMPTETEPPAETEAPSATEPPAEPEAPAATEAPAEPETPAEAEPPAAEEPVNGTD